MLLQTRGWAVWVRLVSCPRQCSLLEVGLVRPIAEDVLEARLCL